MTTYCVYKCFYHWSLDLDISLVEHKRFEDDSNYIKPSMSMCFFDPFDSEAFEKYTKGVNISDYKNFLFGNLKQHEHIPVLLGVDFENVTKKFEDYLIGYAIHWQNDSFQFYHPKSLPVDIKKPHVSYIGVYFTWIVKCYSLDFPSEARILEIGVKSQIFPNSTLPRMFGLGVSFHYPNQFLKSFENFKTSWSVSSNTKHLSGMILTINNFEVTIRRNTNEKPCNMDSFNDDQLVYQEFHSRGDKCRPPYKLWNTTYPVCDTMQKMAKANFLFGTQRDNYMQPCQTAEKVIFEYQESDLSDLSVDNDYVQKAGFRDIENLYSNGSFLIATQLLSSRFKVIQHVQKYDLQSLIGNSGGYIGLFLGKISSNYKINYF